MECERLQRLVKSWYAQVQEESMAPARMVAFMNTHIGECVVCLADPVVRQEIEKITAIILPPSKVRKPTSGEEELEYEEEADTSTEEDTEEEETDDDENEEEDEESEDVDDDEEDDLDDEDDD